MISMFLSSAIFSLSELVINNSLKKLRKELFCHFDVRNGLWHTIIFERTVINGRNNRQFEGFDYFLLGHSHLNMYWIIIRSFVIPMDCDDVPENIWWKANPSSGYN